MNLTRAEEIRQFDTELNARVMAVHWDDSRFKSLAMFIGLNVDNKAAKNNAIRTAAWLVDGEDCRNRLDAMIAIQEAFNE